MFRKFFLLLVISFWGVVVLPVPKQASATTPLTLAVIQNLRNLVQLIPQYKPKRQAYTSDAMSPGDGLSTGRSALADLRFNDGSLARIGEEAVFRFLPKTRNFRLSNGTVVLLIPPGRGQTRINTPNAAAAIRGSALFVRYDEQTDTTIVGALTNSGIQISNKDASQKRELKAGQLIIIVKGKFIALYDFDLRTFYETSALVQDLNLTLKHGMPSPDPAIASVQAETAAAVAAQSPIVSQTVLENPYSIKPEISPNLPGNNIIKQTSPVDSLLEAGQVVPNPASSSTSTSTPPNNKPNTTPPTFTPSEPDTPPSTSSPPTSNPGTSSSPPTSNPGTSSSPPTSTPTSNPG
ncbi:FecR family protein, partial [Brasilonema sp. UFV-L1]|uniref:FecR family protein n=1 Tax=Brasilonema sp. UFV-L1 TaxID=2234130 RepID=UPI00145D3E57